VWERLTYKERLAPRRHSDPREVGDDSDSYYHSQRPTSGATGSCRPEYRVGGPPFDSPPQVGSELSRQRLAIRKIPAAWRNLSRRYSALKTRLKVIGLPFLGDVSPFWVGVIGSLAVETAGAVKDCAALDGLCPDRYKRPAYLLFRGLLALAAGTLPVFLEAPKPLTAFYLGASAPLLLDRLARGIKPTDFR
jgi:hypothetical protein